MHGRSARCTGDLLDACPLACTPCLRGSHVLCPSPSCCSRTPNSFRHVYVFCLFDRLGMVTGTFKPFGVFSISQLSISPTVVSSGREASEKKRAETRRGQGQCWGEAGDGARELLPLKLEKISKSDSIMLFICLMPATSRPSRPLH